MQLPQYPRYEEYMDSPVPWLGEVPSDWLFEKGKWHLASRKALNSDGKIDNVLSLTLRGVVNNDPYNPEGLVPKDYRTHQIFDQDDLVFKLIDLENVRTSRVGLVHEQGIMSSAYIRLVMDDRWNARFLYFYFYHLYQAEVFNKIGSGVRSTLGPKDLLDLPIPVLPKEIQERIVAFLDDKTDKIDRAVKIKEGQIALLRERKQIIIQEAVTKGLNPDARMKDSGIDWIGQIPAHWEAVPLKRLFRERNERTRTGQETLFSLRMVEGLIPHDDVSDKEIKDSDLVDYKIVHPGQMVMNRMRASIGLFGVAKLPGLVSPDYAIFDMRTDLFAEFFLRLFKTEQMGSRFRLSSRGLGTGSSGFMRLYTDDFGSISVPLPSREEQVQIVQHIHSEEAKLDSAVGLKRQQIEALKEYKATMINAAVTGKIKVI